MHKPPSRVQKGERNGLPSPAENPRAERLREIARKRIQEIRSRPGVPSRFERGLRVFVEEVRREMREPSSPTS